MLHDLLKTKTSQLHAQLEGLPFFEALQSHALPRVSIANYLRCLAIIHAVLERKLAGTSQDQVARLFGAIRPKLPLLTADLAVVDAASLPSVSLAIKIALDYADDIMRESDPLSLIGPLYVLEGSQNGAMALRRDFARCLEIPEKQLSYLGCYGSATAASWGRFLRALGALTVDDGQQERIAASAVACFKCFERICAALYPCTMADVKYHTAGINFEGGDHAIPQNPAEIALALRAGKAAWDMFPYLEQRYGERGKRFTSSDSCWLVTLAHAPGQDEAARALDWLRNVLAPRGMPTVILEAHLRIIRQAITQEFPGQGKMGAQFDLFLSNREAERRIHLGAQGQSSLIDEFNRRFQACDGKKVASAAELIASAWVDERSGMTGSLPGLCNWMADTARFSSDWIASVDALVAELDRRHEDPRH